MGYLNDDGLSKLLENQNVKFEEIKDMIGNNVLDIPNQFLPYYDESTGRYTKDSIVRWMNLFADSKIYGVKIFKYEYDPSPQAAEKTGANAGLVLEPSYNDYAGRNDYTGRKLFWCHRVNGGCDIDGMPYVTAIEGLDDRFDPYDADTFALTPVYYYKYTEYDDYYLREYCDTKIDGFRTCAGGYTAEGILRPYILRACYQTSENEDGLMLTSTSGRAPLSAIDNTYPFTGSWFNSISYSLMESNNSGITLLNPWDISYRNEFMQLMLGVKSLKCVGVGNTYQYISEPLIYSGNSKYIRLSLKYEGWISNIPIGSYITISTTDAKPIYNSSRPFGDVRLRLPILSIDNTSTYTRVMVQNSIPQQTSYYALLGECPTGLTDNVKGTYGSINKDYLYYNFTAPFKFQNMEWGNGLGELAPHAALITSSSSQTACLQIDNAIESKEIVSNYDIWSISNRYYKDLDTFGIIMVPSESSSQLPRPTSSQAYQVMYMSATSSNGIYSMILDGCDRVHYPNSSRNYSGTGFISARTLYTSKLHYTTSRISTTFLSDTSKY